MGQLYVEDQVEMSEGVANFAQALPFGGYGFMAACAVPTGAGKAQHAAEEAVRGPRFDQPGAIGAAGEPKGACPRGFAR